MAECSRNYRYGYIHTKSGATAKERECVHSEGLYHPADVKPYGYKNRITGCRKQICGVCHVSAFCVIQTEWRRFMANRARDEVIYIRGDEALKKRFDRIKEASGYKGNADF